MSCQAVLQGIFLTHGSNPGLSTLQVDSLPSELPWNPGVGVPLFNQSGVEGYLGCLQFLAIHKVAREHSSFLD